MNCSRNDPIANPPAGARATPLRKAISYQLDGKPILSVDKPCLALASGKELRLCNPTNPRQGVPVKAAWRGKMHEATLPDGGKGGELPIEDYE